MRSTTKIAFLSTLLFLAVGTGQAAGSVEELRGWIGEARHAEAEEGARALLADVEAEGDPAAIAAVLDVLVESRWRGGKATEPETLQLAERALATKEQAYGKEAAEVGESLNNLAVILYFAGDYAGAQPYWERALEIRKATLGPDDPQVAQMMNNLGNLHQTTGDYAAARPLYEESLRIRQKALGPEHPKVAQSLSNLSVLLWAMGDYEAAAPMAKQAMELKQQQLGDAHPVVASSMTAYASILWETGEREKAWTLLEEANVIWEEAYGPEHPEVGASLNNLADLARQSGEFERALPLYQRTLKIWEATYGPDHPRTSLCVFNLAELYAATGKPEESKAMYERAVAMRRSSFGDGHPEVGEGLAGLAAVLATSGDAAALDVALESESIGREHLRLTGRSLAEEEALRYAAVRTSGLDLALSLVADGGDEEARRKTLDSLTRSRAVVLDEMAARRRSIRGATDPEIASAAKSLDEARERLAAHIVRGIGDSDAEEYKAQAEEYRKDKEQAERALAAVSSEFAEEQARGRMGIDDVAANLPDSAAVVSYVVYDRRARGESGDDPELAYMALVLRSGKSDISVVPLGPAEEIEPLVSEWKKEAAGGASNIRRTPEESVSVYFEVGERLRGRIWDPVAERLEGADRVFIVPDGALNLVSFAALPAAKGRYLVEKGPLLHYLSAERDLVPSSIPTNPGGLLALGGPDYDRVASDAADRAQGDGSASGTRSGTCGSFDSLKFKPLPAAEREAEEVVALWARGAHGDADRRDGIVHLSGAAAKEQALKSSVAGQRVLHLATHGFFLGGDCSAPEGGRGFTIAEEPEPPEGIEGLSPLLLSGLALAGANQRQDAAPGAEDGVLTAEEIAGLDLAGVEWAVLSACDTGVGEIQAGEGVFGLRRAVQVAGVHTLIMSLWPVDDQATRQWMNALYEGRLLDDLDSSEAVRNAARTVLKARRKADESTHPFYWAAFVAAGDWR